MFKFIALTFIAYFAIDLAVYSVTKRPNIEFWDVVRHHARMLPVYLVANIVISLAFLSGSEANMKPLVLFNISVAIWAMSLIVTAAVLYKAYPNGLTIIGIALILSGVMLVNYSIKS